MIINDTLQSHKVESHNVFKVVTIHNYQTSFCPFEPII